MDQLARRAPRVVGVDVSAAVIEGAVARCPGLEAHEADVRSLPFEDASFSAVLSNSTLDHFGDRGQIALALVEISRILRPGGTLVLTLDNLRNPLVALRSVIPGSVLRRLGLVPYYVGPTMGPAGLRRAVEGAGLQAAEETAVLHCPRVAAVALSNAIEQRGSELSRVRLLRSLMAWERLERLPTRTVTGHFIAIRARKPG